MEPLTIVSGNLLNEGRSPESADSFNGAADDRQRKRGILRRRVSSTPSFNGAADDRQRKHGGTANVVVWLLASMEPLTIVSGNSSWAGRRVAFRRCFNGAADDRQRKRAPVSRSFPISRARGFNGAADDRQRKLRERLA